jgi:protein-S-isoprenylcysteine O-methyltransferase Ste14
MNWLQIFEYLGLGAFILWSLFERGFSLLNQQQDQGRKSARVSFFLISLFWYGMMAFSIIDAWGIQPTSFARLFWGLRGLGVALSAAGLVIRFVARRDLGKQYSVHVETSDEHQLITEGIYGTLRHPAYLGLLCLFIGIPLSMGSWGSLIIAVAGGIPAVVYRIILEEKSLTQWFGKRYETYRESSWRIIPNIW